MGMALREAEAALARGEFPVGCVIVQAGQVIAKGSREGTSGGSPLFSETEHAEMRCLANAEKQAKVFDPAGADLYCTMEPCLMCFGAILIYGIRRVVYAFEDPMGGGLGCDLGSLPPLYRDRRPVIVPGILREKSLELFYTFFKRDRNAYWRGSLLEKYAIGQFEGREEWTQ